MQALSKKAKQEELSRLEQKWTPKLMEVGWTVIPSIILEKQHAFELRPVDVNVLMQLLKYWWFSDNPPRPSKRAIAESMNVCESTVQRSIARMEEKGLIRREKRISKRYGQQPNYYHFDGLINRAKPFAEEALQEKKRKKKEDSERRIRRKPQHLRKVKG
jgi:predicted transcriptional regulator